MSFKFENLPNISGTLFTEDFQSFIGNFRYQWADVARAFALLKLVEENPGILPAQGIQNRGNYLKTNGDYAEWFDIVSQYQAYVRSYVPSFKTPASVTVNSGGTPVGTIAGTTTMNDASVYQVPELAATPGFSIDFTFTGINRIKGIAFNVWYNGLSTHQVTMRLYNNSTTSYDVVKQIITTLGYDYHTIFIPSGVNYINDDREVVLRFYHDSLGDAAHDIYFDFLAIIE